MIVIESRREGFRRAGKAHSKKPTAYPDGYFTEKELDILRAETMLTVSVVPDAVAPGTKGDKALEDGEIENKAAADAEKANVKPLDEKPAVSSPAAQPQMKDKKAKDSKK